MNLKLVTKVLNFLMKNTLKITETHGQVGENILTPDDRTQNSWVTWSLMEPDIFFIECSNGDDEVLEKVWTRGPFPMNDLIGAQIERECMIWLRKALFGEYMDIISFEREVYIAGRLLTILGDDDVSDR